MIATRAARTFALTAAVLIGGCVETRFESSLTGTAASCDARLKGYWIASDAGTDSRQDETTAVDAQDGCSFTLITQPERDGPLKRTPLPLYFLHDHGSNYLVVADTALMDVVSLKPPHAIEPSPRQSYFLARYTIHGDRVDVQPVDSARVAKLIIDSKLDGTIDKAAHELHVFVRGDRAHLLNLVREHSIFDASTSLHLVRSRQTPDAPAPTP